MSILASQSIGFIGAGNMAEALIRGLVRGGHIAPERVMASAPRNERLAELREAYGVTVTRDNREVARGSKLVVLSPASHFANRDQPEAWNRAAVEFLARVDGPARPR